MITKVSSRGPISIEKSTGGCCLWDKIFSPIIEKIKRVWKCIFDFICCRKKNSLPKMEGKKVTKVDGTVPKAITRVANSPKGIKAEQVEANSGSVGRRSRASSSGSELSNSTVMVSRPDSRCEYPDSDEGDAEVSLHNDGTPLNMAESQYFSPDPKRKEKED